MFHIWLNLSFELKLCISMQSHKNYFCNVFKSKEINFGGQVSAMKAGRSSLQTLYFKLITENSSFPIQQSPSFGAFICTK